MKLILHDLDRSYEELMIRYGDSLTVYHDDLTEYVTISGAEFAKRAVMRPDGTVLLIGASRAWLYIPE